jgi:hypothetical protein
MVRLQLFQLILQPVEVLDLLIILVLAVVLVVLVVVGVILIIVVDLAEQEIHLQQVRHKELVVEMDHHILVLLLVKLMVVEEVEQL